MTYIIAYVKTQKKIRFIIHYVKPTAQLLFRIRFPKGGPYLIKSSKSARLFIGILYMYQVYHSVSISILIVSANVKQYAQFYMVSALRNQVPSWDIMGLS